jgi:hypothetical protein
MSELKPCPWCKKTTVVIGMDTWLTKKAQAICGEPYGRSESLKGCGARGPVVTIEEGEDFFQYVIDAWDRRAE